MKYILLTVLILVATILIAQVVITKSTDQTNSISYEVLAEENGIEIRKYSELLVASTNLPKGSYGQNSGLGFRRIASYIFGGNSTNSQIAMTSPVRMNMSTNATMSFYMPEDMTRKDLPVPNEKTVNIKTEPEHTVAVIEFSGWANDEILEEKFEELKSKLNGMDIKFENTYSYLGYNPPYQLTDRKNEVIINLKNYTNEK